MVWTPFIVRKRVFAYAYTTALSLPIYASQSMATARSVEAGLSLVLSGIVGLMGWTALAIEESALFSAVGVHGVGVVFALAAEQTDLFAVRAATARTASFAVIIGFVVFATAYTLRSRYQTTGTPEERVLGHDLDLDVDSDADD